jgi:hypothetical protein
MPDNELPPPHTPSEKPDETDKPGFPESLDDVLRVLRSMGDIATPGMDLPEDGERYDFSIPPATYDEQLTPQEIIERLDAGYTVKVAPRFGEQMEARRTNEITYIGSDGTSHVITERQAIDDTKKYLQVAIAAEDELWHDPSPDEMYMKDQVRSISENLTFIGEKEYEEAAAGMALYWKSLLDTNSQLQILALAGLDKEDEKIKSDDYLLDNILARFTDEEVEEYQGRLITDPSDITVADPRNLRAILVDDWTISATQLNEAAAQFRREHPMYASSVEVQLVTASKDQIVHGLSSKIEDLLSNRPAVVPIPVRAYFVAHDAPVSWDSQVHITGSHSSVDFDFQDILEKVARRAGLTETLAEGEGAVLETMPPLTRIIRPYRAEDFEPRQKYRFKLPDNSV